METIRLKVYRYNPDTDAKPYMQDYELEIEPTDVKLLDAIMKLKAKDDSLSFGGGGSRLMGRWTYEDWMCSAKEEPPHRGEEGG